MKTRGGWSETSTHKHTGAANGDPIEVDVDTVRERLFYSGEWDARERVGRIDANSSYHLGNTRDKN